jgi:hypothetical protein
MGGLLEQALTPALHFIDCLRKWRSISQSLREPPRKKRSYQQDLLYGDFFG